MSFFSPRLAQLMDDGSLTHSFFLAANHESTINLNNSSDEMNSVNALLKEHGIAMQEDTDNTLITSALQSGRQLVLSDAGKLLLNDPKFRKSIPSVTKQTNIMTSAANAKVPVTTKPSIAPSMFKFEYVKKKPTILASNAKAVPLETNKVTHPSFIQRNIDN